MPLFLSHPDFVSGHLHVVPCTDPHFTYDFSIAIKIKYNQIVPEF